MQFSRAVQARHITAVQPQPASQPAVAVGQTALSFLPFTGVQSIVLSLSSARGASSLCYWLLLAAARHCAVLCAGRFGAKITTPLYHRRSNCSGPPRPRHNSTSLPPSIHRRYRQFITCFIIVHTLPCQTMPGYHRIVLKLALN